MYRLLIVSVIILAMVVCPTFAVPTQSMPSIVLPGLPYHPVGWDHDGTPMNPGWERVMDAGDTMYYWGDVTITTDTRDVVGSFYAARTGAPWIIADVHGQVTASGGPNAQWPKDMTFTHYRWGNK